MRSRGDGKSSEKRDKTSLTDLHTHILPGMDDGSKSPEMSVQMLKSCAEQGVTRLLLAPHYYSSKETIDNFLSRRAASFEALQAEVSQSMSTPPLPEIYLGCECRYFVEMSKSPDLKKLCFGAANCLLVEMPFTVWSLSVVGEVCSLLSEGYAVILAHIERYIGSTENLRHLDDFLEAGAVIQTNAEFFLEKSARHSALKMLRDNSLHVFGSDCHNVTTRPPNMGFLREILDKKRCGAYLSAAESLCTELLTG